MARDEVSCHLERATTDNNILKKISWDSSTYKSTAWEDFDQAAHFRTGVPVLICKNCKADITHPNIHATGTKALKNYTDSRACRKSEKMRSGVQSTLCDNLPLLVSKVNYLICEINH